MRKIILSLLLGASLCTPAFAQLDDDKIVQLGLRGVVNGSWIGNLPKSLNDVKANSENMQLGFSGGIWLRLRMPITGLYIQPEINIAQQNGKYAYQIVPNANSGSTAINPPVGSTYDDSRSLSLTNLELPLSLGFKLKLGQIGLRINAGGVVSGIIAAKEIYTQRLVQSTGTSVELSEEQKINDKVNALQAGLQGGLGIDFGSRISLDVRLQQNLTKLYETQTDPLTRATVAQADQKITSGQLVLGIRLF